MGRKKGSLNKNNQHVQLNFDSNIKSFEKKTEVCMTTGILEDVPTEEKLVLSRSESEELEQIQKELDLARVELEKTKLEIEENKKSLSALPVAKEVKDAPAASIEGQTLKAKIAAQKAYDNQMVTGKFSNLRAPGNHVKLPYIKYEDDPVKWWTFNHGEVYTIPRGFADQLNGGSEDNPCYYMPHFIKNEGAIIDPNQPESGIHAVDTSNKKYMFSPINF